MAYMHHLDWLFAIGTLFFLMSAWALGKSHYRLQNELSQSIC